MSNVFDCLDNEQFEPAYMFLEEVEATLHHLAYGGGSQDVEYLFHANLMLAKSRAEMASRLASKESWLDNDSRKAIGLLSDAYSLTRKLITGSKERVMDEGCVTEKSADSIEEAAERIIARYIMDPPENEGSESGILQRRY